MTELEELEEFGGLLDFMKTFNLLRGKKTDDEDDEERRYSGNFKVIFSVLYFYLS